MNLETDLESAEKIPSRTSSGADDNGDFESKQNVSFHRTSSSFGSSRRRHSLKFDDIESETVSQAGDIGDRALQSNRNSESGSSFRLSVDNSSRGVLAIPADDSFLQTYGVWFRNNDDASNNISPLSPLEIISTLPTDAIMSSRDQPQMETSTQQLDKDNQRQLPESLKYISGLAHLAVFGILGVLTRFLLEKLFGPSILGVTSDGSFIYLDLPPNMVGSFLMGWLGVVFKVGIHRVSDLLDIGLTTGFLGSLTTFSGWNQKMLDLSVRDRWVFTMLGFLIGLFLADISITVGIYTAKGFRWLLKRLSTRMRSGMSTSSNNWKVNNYNRDLLILVVVLLTLGLLLGISGALLKRNLDDDSSSNAYLWLGCMVGPLGVWTRWYLARLNGRGLGRNGLMIWVPFGTLLANVSAACIMAALATMKKEVKSKRFETIAMGIQFGFLGCLSTVSTFIAEFHAMRHSRHWWRACIYAIITIVPSFVLGTLIYSVPVWTLGSQ